MTGRTVLSLLLGVSVLAAANATSAAAEEAAQPEADAGEDIEAIVVTARKREENIVDVPTAASAFGASTLITENISGTRDVFNRIPGVTMIEFGRGGYSSEPILRGVGVGQTTLNLSESATGLYRNDAYYAGGAIGGRAFTALDYFDVAQVEVYRGPQGALFGRNAVGGAISLVSQAPVFDSTGRAELSAGTNERLGASAIVNFPASEQVALRFGLLAWDQDDGFVKGSDGRAIDDENAIGARAAMLWRTGDLRALAFVDFFDFDGPSSGKATGAQSFFNVAVPALSDPFRKPPELNIDPRVKQNDVNATLNLSYDTAIGTLTSISFFKHRDGSELHDYDWNLVTPANVRVIDPNITDLTEEDFQSWSQELRLVSPEDGRLTWLLGLVYGEQTVDLSRVVSGATIGGPGPATTRTLDDQINTVIDLDSTSVSAYGVLGYDLIERLNVSVEARYTRDEKDFVNRTTRFNYVAGICCTPQLGVTDLKESWTSLAGAVVGQYELAPNRNIYARLARSYRPGGFNEDPGIAPGGGSAGFAPPETFDQEKTVAAELGFKGQFLDRRLTLSASATRTRVYGVLTPTLCQNVGATPNPNCTRQVLFTFNSANTKVNSLEGELAYVQPDILGGTATLRLTGALNSSEYTKVNSLGVPLNALPRLGGKAQWVRPEAFTTSLTFRRPLSDRADFYINGSYAYQNGGTQNATNTVFLTRLSQIDLNAGAEFGSWALRASVKNLADRLRFVFISGNTRQINEPRTFLLTLSRSW
jgi:iron complex outermembrane recepter protein